MSLVSHKVARHRFWRKAVLGAVTAWVVVYAAYFALLLLVDAGFGGSHVWAELEFASRRTVAEQILGILVDSAGVVLPFVTLAAVFSITGPGGSLPAAAAVRIFATAIAAALVTWWLGFAPVAMLVFAGATGIASLVAWWAVQRVDRARS